MGLRDRLNAAHAQRVNNDVCQFQQTLHTPIERAYGQGKITRDQYVAQMNAANEQIRTFTRDKSRQ